MLALGVRYASAVLLVCSSIALVSYQVITIQDVAAGLLYYVAQAFLLVASIFGLDYYIKIISHVFDKKHPKGNQEQQSTESTNQFDTVAG